MGAVKNYMAELDEWTDEAVIEPISKAMKRHVESRSDEDGEPNYDPEAEAAMQRTIEQAKKAIRGKVLESYHNGQSVRPRASQGPWRARK